MHKRVIGLDIGGANLKASDGYERSLSRPFPLWERPDDLPQALRDILMEFTGVEELAVAMTGELADCFASKAEGVAKIVDAVESATDGIPIKVWQTGGEFFTAAEAREFPILVAAANWHALATWGARMAPRGCGLLIDIGSTTTDIIPLVDGAAAPTGFNDLERLISGELVYSGVRRTPLFALAHSVPFRESHCPLAAERFATTLDLYLLADDVGENTEDLETADGRPATRGAAHARIARSLCADVTQVSYDEACDLARFLADVHQQRIAGAMRRVLRGMPTEPQVVLVSGEGEFLARRLIETGPLASCEVTSLSSAVGPEHSQAACAFALARLAAER